jgi:hypothetical protein
LQSVEYDPRTVVASPADSPQMADETLADVGSAGKIAAEALAGRLGVGLDPGRARRRLAAGRADVLVSADGTRAWWLGPVSASALAEAAGVPDPLRRLIRLTPGGIDAVYKMAAMARGAAYLADLDGLVPTVPRPPPARLVARLRAVAFAMPDGRRIMVVAPEPADLLDRLDALAAGDAPFAVTTPRRLEAAMQRQLGGRTMAAATALLHDLDTPLSARGRPGRGLRGALAALALAAPAAVALAPTLTWAVVHAVSAVSFACLGYLRTIALSTEREAGPTPAGERRLPSYSVLVALYREAHMVEGLLAALDRLDYPRDRLEIRLLLEADDTETRRKAERAIRHRPDVAIAVCPPGAPRTKPRALAYGLAFAAGDLVTVYDAEDRPHPGQLRAAAAAFDAGPANLACVQARLVIDRVRTPIQRQFAIEYAVLFEGILPWLGDRALPLPLGGTSNHFRRAALETALGWDPWNVTEDADLGIRLMRYGFAVDVLDSETAEEAPATASVWLRQRRRWIKGWIVTALVHLRRPRVLAREIGWRNTSMIAVHLVANVGAPLVHPLGLAILALTAVGVIPLPLGRSFAGDLLVGASSLGIAFGYGASMVFTRRLLLRRGRAELARSVWWMPVYWLLGSLAAWRAVADLVVDPHHWAKTPHEAHEEEVE